MARSTVVSGKNCIWPLMQKTHKIICADLSLNNVIDAKAFPGPIRQTHRKIQVAAADGAYDTQLCNDEPRRKKIRPSSPSPRWSRSLTQPCGSESASIEDKCSVEMDRIKTAGQ
ncbi:hypothetical protein DES54_12815 [Brenneria salicis ATCC 15712 = DSM 30166]|uniref:DDE family transposase n=1 Tax=Brenneria salicis ATCC 15712 = DSM 30166 TaxID=714314 RepID=A0A366I0Q4_9GAMM|nr:hypothetical protein DES54_12815 [Brenneria salicis ATCC 15712 = DSM 30166]